MTRMHTILVRLNFWGVNQLCTTGNDRFRMARGLQPSLLFVWRVMAQLAAVPLPLWPDVSGLLGPHQPVRQASRRQRRKEWRSGGLTEEKSCWLSTLVPGLALCQIERRLPCTHHDLHSSVATGILVCTSRLNNIPSWSVSTTMFTEQPWKLCKCTRSSSVTLPYCGQRFLWTVTHSWI